MESDTEPDLEGIAAYMEMLYFERSRIEWVYRCLILFSRRLLL